MSKNPDVDKKTLAEVFMRSCEIFDVEKIEKHNISIESTVSIKEFMTIAKLHKSQVMFLLNGTKDEGIYHTIMEKNVLLTARSPKLH